MVPIALQIKEAMTHSLRHRMLGALKTVSRGLFRSLALRIVCPPLQSAHHPSRVVLLQLLAVHTPSVGTAGLEHAGLHHWPQALQARGTGRRSWVNCVPPLLAARCDNGVAERPSAHVVRRTCILQSR